eukprot:TRINITY_DN27244_c0_g1_i1.p3 TRINITY_DN27244_c0_g1~~TRINITY_DN27244_c0_g1_i1.p3  ORF type:complete len:180 (+),score=49.84 TRINITY_DN27244_c0_g1_i1:79-618(+)
MAPKMLAQADSIADDNEPITGDAAAKGVVSKPRESEGSGSTDVPDIDGKLDDMEAEREAWAGVVTDATAFALTKASSPCPDKPGCEEEDPQKRGFGEEGGKLKDAPCLGVSLAKHLGKGETGTPGKSVDGAGERQDGGLRTQAEDGAATSTEDQNEGPPSGDTGSGEHAAPLVSPRRDM